MSQNLAVHLQDSVKKVDRQRDVKRESYNQKLKNIVDGAREQLDRIACEEDQKLKAIQKKHLKNLRDLLVQQAKIQSRIRESDERMQRAYLSTSHEVRAVLRARACEPAAAE